MKRGKMKRVLATVLCAVLLTGILPAGAMAAESGEENAVVEEQKAAAESGIALQIEETEEGTQETEVTEAVTTDEAAEVDDTAKTAENDSSNAGGIPVEDEKPNTDITVTPSDANALILMDVGAQSPKGEPGDVVTVVLPVAVNKEYLPSEKYMLRNINVYPDIPTDNGVANWPFDIINASDVRHLKDMSYNSTAEIYYDFRISQFAEKGVYPVNFKVNATVWRYDDVNGTSITEDVTFSLGVYVTIVDDGNLSGVTTTFGSLQVAGSNVNGSYAIPTGVPKQTITMRVPVVNVGGTLTNVTVGPVVSTSLDEFPFVAEATNYNRFYDSWESGEIKYLDYTFTVSPFATSGNKAIKFKASYYENSAAAEGTFSTQFTVSDGYDASAMSVMVKKYQLYVDGTEVSGLMAGEETELWLTLVNNSRTDTAKKVVSNLVFTNAPGLMLCVGASDTAYADSIKPGGTVTMKYKIMAKQDAEVGAATLGVSLTYETTEAVAGKAAQNIMLPVSQVMELTAGTPEVYGTPTKGKETTISIPLTNMGRAKALNIRVLASDGFTADAPAYVGDLLAGGSTSADVTVSFSKVGNFTGRLILQYEDANGQSYSQEVPVTVNVADEAEMTEAVSDNVQKGGIGSHWWLWLLIFLLVLILIVAVICFVLYLKKRKNENPEEEETDDFEDLSEEFDDTGIENSGENL